MFFDLESATRAPDGRKLRRAGICSKGLWGDLSSDSSSLTSSNCIDDEAAQSWACGWYSDREGDSWVGVAVGPSEAKPAPREEEGWVRG